MIFQFNKGFVDEKIYIVEKKGSTNFFLKEKTQLNQLVKFYVDINYHKCELNNSHVLIIGVNYLFALLLDNFIGMYWKII